MRSPMGYGVLELFKRITRQIANIDILPDLWLASSLGAGFRGVTFKYYDDTDPPCNS